MIADNPKEDWKLDVNNIGEKDFIKVYKSARGKKPTLKNLKRRREVHSIGQKMSKKAKIDVKNKKLLLNVVKSKKN